MYFKKEEISKEVNNLILEVVMRLERENPQLLRSLILTTKEEPKGLRTIPGKKTGKFAVEGHMLSADSKFKKKKKGKVC
jgi:hypothetical protein